MLAIEWAVSRSDIFNKSRMPELQWIASVLAWI
jgi:hypothetical protein